MECHAYNFVPFKANLHPNIFCSIRNIFCSCFHANNKNKEASFRTFEQRSRSKIRCYNCKVVFIDTEQVWRFLGLDIIEFEIKRYTEISLSFSSISTILPLKMQWYLDLQFYIFTYWLLVFFRVIQELFGAISKRTYDRNDPRDHTTWWD